MDLPAQPNYARVAGCFREIADNAALIADDAALLHNVFAVNIGEQILLELRQIRMMHERTNDRLDTVFIAMDANAAARTHNFKIHFSTIKLQPLKNKLNEVCPGFPEYTTDIANYTSEQLSNILSFYGQDVSGNRGLKRKRFQAFIGLSSVE